ncbi:MAG: nucleotidyltransferase family protein [Gemmatimonadaceae bacterium]
MIGAVVLAAGRGERFGGEKVLAEVRGIALVRHVVDRLRLAGVSSVVVVAGPAPDGVRAALAGTDADIVPNPAPSDGMSASLALGVAALPEEVDAFVVALGDQPFIDAAVVRALGETWRDSNAAAVVPMYRDGRGNPVLFDASMRRRLQALEGDMGARELLAAMGDRVLRVPVDADAPRDVDTPGDLQALGG